MTLKGWRVVKPQNTESMDGRPTEDQEVLGSTPTGSATFFIVKYFLRSFPSADSRKKGSCQFLAKECAQYWLTA